MDLFQIYFHFGSIEDIILEPFAENNELNDYTTALNLHVLSITRIFKGVLPYMLQNGGKLILISSIWTLFIGMYIDIHFMNISLSLNLIFLDTTGNAQRIMNESYFIGDEDYKYQHAILNCENNTHCTVDCV